jgi:hypothetical protein
MALPGMGTTSYEDMRGLRAAGGGPRAARPRERTFVDHEMGSLHLVGGQRGAPEFGAWACMTHCPYEAPKPVPRPQVEVEPPKPAPPPVYDVAAEETRRRKALQQRERWENAENSCLPPGDEKPLSSSRLQKRDLRPSPFATTLNDEPVEPVKPRGTRRLTGPESISEADLAARRGRKKVESNAAKSAFGIGGSVVPSFGADITCAAAPSGDAYAIGNPRAESFVLRTRSTKRVGIQPQRTESADWAHRPSAVKMVSSTKRDCIGFGGGGDGGLSAELPPQNQGRKVIEREPPTQEDRPRGVRRQGFERDEADRGVFGDASPQLHGTVPISNIPKPDIGEKLRHFGAWYLQQYGEPPSREALEHAAAQLAAEAVEEKPSLQSQIKSYEARREPVDPRAQHFVEWYTKEYGEAPPQELIDRAATTFMVSGESNEVEAPEKSVMSGNDPIRPHVAKPLAFAPPEPSSPQKPIRGRGQRSTLSLGWD